MSLGELFGEGYLCAAVTPGEARQRAVVRRGSGGRLAVHSYIWAEHDD
jgi:hypothetical protein